MRPKVLEISWHETQAVYSCDFQPLPIAQLKRLLSEDDDKEKEKAAGPLIAGGRQYRLATAGGDSKVRIWLVHPNIPSSSASAQAALTGQEVAPHPPRAEYLATLSKHTAAVNVVRFSPNGATLASAGDDGNVILWVPSDKPQTGFGEATNEDVVDKEHWRAQRILQVTTKHVYDLAWSPDSEFLIAGSTDNTASIWKAGTGECVYAMREHQHNVQGVAWDPLNEYIATQSSDRSVHVNSFGFSKGMPDVHPVSRATRMEIRHSRTPSFPSGSRPNLARRGSNVSEAGSAITSASEFTEPAQPIPRHLATPMTPSASASIPSTPQPMDPPASSAKPGSRRSSFSGSQAAGSPALSTSAFHGSRSGRSPSPIPPLPAVRPPSNHPQSIMQRLYGEEGVTRFFRRLTFSPDGSLLLTPAGQIEDQIYKGSPLLLSRSLSQDGTEGSAGHLKPKNVESGKPTVYIYSRGNLAKTPVAHLPGHKTSSVAIRFSPIFYDLRTASMPNGSAQPEPKQITLDRSEPGPINVSLSMPPPPPPSKEKEGEKEKEKEKEKPLGSIFALPYRLLYAVACQDAVLLYDTQQAGPIAIFKGLHYAGFTDVAWSPDGQSLMLSSADGYCSIVVFDMAELGTVHATQQHHRQLQAIAQSHAHPLPPTASSTPVPHSPAISTTRQSPAPARSEREGSTASSIVIPPPPFNPPSQIHGAGPAATATASSTTSSVEPVLPTPSEENDGFAFPRLASGSESGASVAAAPAPKSHEPGAKRPGEEGEAPKKKRRVALNKVEDE